MALQGSWINFGKGDAWRGYFAYPEPAPKLPALVLIQEAWGVDAHIQDVARRFAAQGYAVLAPDLFAKDGKRPEALAEARVGEAKDFLNSLPPGAWGRPEERDAALAKLPAGQGQRVSESMAAIFGGIQSERPKHLGILRDASTWLRGSFSPSRGAKLGAIGFCMGGGLAGAMAAEDPKLAAAVIFYGQAIPTEKIPQVSCKVLAFHGATDTRLVDVLPEFEKEMKLAGKHLELHIYAGAGHAFFNDTRPSYDAAASKDAFECSLQFLKEELS